MQSHEPKADSSQARTPAPGAEAELREGLGPNRSSAQAAGKGARSRLRAVGKLLVSLLLGGLAVLGSMTAFRLGLLPLIESAFQPGPSALSAIRRAGLISTALAGYWTFVRWHAQRKASELHLRPRSLLWGGASGAAMVALPMALLYALGAYELVLFRGFAPSLLGVAVVIAIAATLEELVFRCLLFQILEQAWGTRWALAIQALLFSVQHLENVADGGTRDALTMLVSVTLTGLLWGAVFVLARNLWTVAAHHAAWNFTILLSGLPLSGIEDWRKLAPLESRYAGPDWLTGGIFGPESSLLVIASTTVAVVLLLRAAGRRGAFSAAA